MVMFCTFQCVHVTTLPTWKSRKDSIDRGHFSPDRSCNAFVKRIWQDRVPHEARAFLPDTVNTLRGLFVLRRNPTHLCEHCGLSCGQRDPNARSRDLAKEDACFLVR